MADERSQIIDQAVARLDPLDRPSLDRIADLPNGLWYLKRNIVGATSDALMHAHTRPLKYAALFDARGAEVTFIKESASKTHDLDVVVCGHTVAFEVRKFGMDAGQGASDPVSKIVDAIRAKRTQLPHAEIGFVAIDNFDLRLEPVFGHELLWEALIEAERLAESNPGGWERPSGVILAAASTMGSGPVIRFPHFIWRNPYAECVAPDPVLNWIRSSLPDAQLFDASTAAAGISGDDAFDS